MVLPKPLSHLVFSNRHRQEGGRESGAFADFDGKPQQVLEGRESSQVSGGRSLSSAEIGWRKNCIFILISLNIAMEHGVFID